MDSPFRWFEDQLQRLEEDGLRRTRRSVTSTGHGWCRIDGHSLCDFASNDYLGLAADPRLRKAAHDAVDDVGTGARASPLVSGRTDWHDQLEKRLARFEEAEAALLFPTGYAANVGTIAALVDEQDVVLTDRLNHASLIDGCRLSGARMRVIRHADIEQYERELKKAADARHRLIVTDGVFSMDGDLAPLVELAELAERFDAWLLVDEAHGTGVFGHHGRGVCELRGIHSPGLIRVGTLSKAVGAQGGFVVGPQSLIDWLWNRARTQVFSTALAPPCCAAALRAIDIIEQTPEMRIRLHHRCDDVRARLIDAGLPVPENATGPIIPVVIGDPQKTVRAAQVLFEDGFFVAAIRPPTVPRNTARLRLSLSLAHSDDDVDALTSTLIDVARTETP
ncbi:8-amino-7-oxononanoate synthase 2 [Maioricimonas rarisocia]|uniref:8-amino-7-ketopelargonate synthase n=1 Tax=Maioricimonas rarisocia TaxID=2528026 RepID=A0A517ZBT3_9PLAN|nr:8-amino-7-oxononanoate synthase [Maioricimonas rarisocia]QDU39891.1 8-amino-7-oxononanoate synthase 2 [Maioricimonas rarisocia]